MRDIHSAQKHDTDTTVSVHISSTFNLQKQRVHPWQSHLFPHEYYFSEELQVPWSNGSLFMSVLEHWAYFSISVRNSTRKDTNLQNLTTTGAQDLWWSKVEHDLDSTPTLGTSCKGINNILLVESKAVSDKGFDINATTANEVQTQWICVAVSENTKNVHFPIAHKVLKESDHKRKFIYPSTCYYQDILIYDMHSS